MLAQLLSALGEWLGSRLSRFLRGLLNGLGIQSGCSAAGFLGLRPDLWPHPVLGFHRDDPREIMPRTEKLRKGEAASFISDIDRNAVTALASRYNKGLTCTLDEEATAHGSFNVVFFIEFPSTKQHWVVRIPIITSVPNAWEKLQSEVCTIEYLCQQTPIPIPRVHAHGQARLRRGNNTPLPFMIMDRAAGTPLSELLPLSKRPKEQRRKLFSELIDIYEHLRRLEFPAAGSLMPSRWWRSLLDHQPRIVSSISLAKAEIIADGYTPPQQIPTTLSDYLTYQRRLLWDLFLAPTQDLSPKSARSELFSLHSIGDELQRMASESKGNSRREIFILSHMDLRPPNILVDIETGGIVAIIDWEWACTVPARHFTPPDWFMAFDDYQDVLASKHAGNPDSQLLCYWEGLKKNTPDHVIATIFQRPTDKLVDKFRREIFHQVSKESWDNAVEAFFNNNEDHKRELQEHQERCDRYTQYLKDHGLYEAYVETEEERRCREFWEKAALIVEKWKAEEKAATSTDSSCVV